MARLRVGRVHEAPSDDDGRRIPVDRLWPRGLDAATLLHAARDQEHHNAVVLLGWLREHRSGYRPGQHRSHRARTDGAESCVGQAWAHSIAWPP